MKRTETSYLRAMSNAGKHSSYLQTYQDTIEGIKQEIDEANARAVKLGYKEEQFLITCTEVYCYCEDDGTFIKKETIESAVEVYPKEV